MTYYRMDPTAEEGCMVGCCAPLALAILAVFALTTLRLVRWVRG